MTNFTITEDFPKNEIKFDKRFSEPRACYDYLFQQKWPEGRKPGRSQHIQVCI